MIVTQFDEANGTSICGNYRTRTFGAIFYPEKGSNESSYEVFRRKLAEASGIPMKIKENNLQTLFYLLYAHHAADNIASNDENQFLYKLQSIIFMYGPTWEKRLEVQDGLRALTEDDLKKGGEAIYNTAQAPGTPTAGLVDSDGKLDFLNSQNTTSYKKSTLEGYTYLLSVLDTDVTKEFLDKFQKLFVPGIIYRPEWHVNTPEYISLLEE